MSGARRWFTVVVVVPVTAVALVLVPILYLLPFVPAQFDPAEVCGRFLGRSFEALQEQYFPLPRQTCRGGVLGVDTVTPADALPAVASLLAGLVGVGYLLREAARCRPRPAAPVPDRPPTSASADEDQSLELRP